MSWYIALAQRQALTYSPHDIHVHACMYITGEYKQLIGACRLSQV